MALYKFKVTDSAGTVSELLIEGDSQADATRRVQSRGLLPLAFLGEGTGGLRTDRRGELPFRRRFDVVEFTDQLVPLLEAQIPLERSLGILSETLPKGYASNLVEELRKGLHEGRRLSQMLRDRGHVFPELYASLVEAGEESGALVQIMGDLRKFLNERRELTAYVISASIYPLIVLGVSLVVLGVLLGVMVPKFATVLVAAGVEPSFATRALIAISGLVRGYWWVVPLLVVVGAVFLSRARRNPSSRMAFDAFVLRVPLMRRVVLYSEMGRMARTMSILMRHGVHILDTVAISARVLQNSVLRQSLAGVATDLRRGERLALALGRIDCFPPIMVRMVAVGEETGNVETMLERIAQRFEVDLRRLIARALSILEPAVIVGLGLIVGLIVVTMFLAIMEMQSAI